MIILIAGASHTGKTALAQKLLENDQYPYLSIDHLKMGLIRSGNTQLTPMSSRRDLTDYLWPIVREIIKTAIENQQNLVVEGCYIPFVWEKDFDKEYLKNIKYCCLIMSEGYIHSHFADIRAYANVMLGGRRMYHGARIGGERRNAHPCAEVFCQLSIDRRSLRHPIEFRLICSDRCRNPTCVPSQVGFSVNSLDQAFF